MKMGMPDILFINTDGFKGGDPENLEVWFEYMGALEGSIPASVHEYHHSRTVEALRRENEELKANLDESDETAIILADRNAELGRKLDKAKDALRFYCNKENYQFCAGYDETGEVSGSFPPAIDNDKGQRARKTLEEM